MIQVPRDRAVGFASSHPIAQHQVTESDGTLAVYVGGIGEEGCRKPGSARVEHTHDARKALLERTDEALVRGLGATLVAYGLQAGRQGSQEPVNVYVPLGGQSQQAIDAHDVGQIDMEQVGAIAAGDLRDGRCFG